MEPGQSGRARAARATENADTLEAQARELLQRAEQSRLAAGWIILGNEGEQIIGTLLDELTTSGWVVLHDRRRQPGSPANLDHVLVGPAGVFVIDTKNWTGGRLRFDDRGMAVAKWRKDDELHAAKVDGDIVREHVDALGADAQTVAVLAFVHDMGLVGPVEHKRVVLVQREQLLTWLHGLPAVLTAEHVANIATALDQRLPARLLAPAPARPVTAAMKRKERARHKARRELKAVAVKLAILAVCIPVAPWVIQHVVSAATPHIISHLVPPTPVPTRAPAAPAPLPSSH